MLLLIIALAFARGVYGLGTQSLWWDESLSLQRANYSLSTVLSNKIILTDATRQVITFDNHPPLYFLLLHFMVKLAGQSEFVLRFPSLAFSVLTVPLLYAVGKLLFDRRVGLLVALFGAISPLYLWYSQEVRMYTMLAFLGLLSFYALLRILTSSVKREASNGKLETSSARRQIPNIHPTIIYVVSSAAMLATHYLSFLILLAELLVAVTFIRSARWRRVAIPVLGVILVSMPILYYGFSTFPKGEMAGFRFVPLIELLLDVSNSFGLGISVRTEQVLAVHWVFRGIFLIGVVAATWKALRPLNPKAWSPLIYLSAPIFSIYLLSYVQPVYLSIRHLILASPAFYLILAVGLVTVSKKWPLVFASCLALMVAGAAHSTQQYFLNEKYTKDDHRAWGEYLKAHAQPGDVVVVDPPHVSQLYQYYADAGLPWTGLPRLVSPDEDTISALEELMDGYERIWVAFSGIPGWGDPKFLPREWLEENAFLVNERSFHNYASVVQASCFLTHSPVLDATPEIQHPMEASFEGQLLFLGYDLKGRPAASGQFLRLSLYWEAPQKLEKDYGVSLRLLDGENRLWGQADRAPLDGHYPTSQWPSGQIIKDDYELFIDFGAPPGWYRLEMVVHEGLQELAVLDENLNPRGAADMGVIQVEKSASSPDVASLALGYRSDLNFGDIRLLGYDLSEGNYRPGDWVWVQTYWRAVRKPADDYSLYFRLVDENKQLWVQQVISPAGHGYPTTFWDEGEIVKGQHALRIPVEAPGGDYHVGVVLREPKDPPSGGPLTSLLRAVSSDDYALDIGKISVIEVERGFDVPAMQYPYQANLGGLVELLGYDLEGTGFSSGETLLLTLYWRALEQMNTSYTVFTHLIDENNHIWGQQDNPPQEGRHPTTVWLKDEVVIDKYSITVDPDAPSGQYAIEIGLYNAETWVRLPVLDEQGKSMDDRVLLQKVWVIAETTQ